MIGYLYFLALALVGWSIVEVGGSTALIFGSIVSSIATTCTTVYLHRAEAHGALELKPSAKAVFKFFLWLTTGTNVRNWVAVHRKHHHFSDKEGDPHSPYQSGLLSILFLNAFYYYLATKTPGIVEKYASNIQNTQTWADRKIFNRGWIGILLGTVLLCLLLGPWVGLMAALIHFVLYVVVLLGLVNGLCHSRHGGGYQSYDRSSKQARELEKIWNIRWVAFITAGEGLHGNHHERVHWARLWHKRWEVIFDPGWWVIWPLKQLRLATEVKPLESQVNA